MIVHRTSLVLAMSGGSAAAGDETIETVVAHVGPSVVRLAEMRGGEQVASGTGFLIREDGIVVTNHHVVADVSGTMEAVLRGGEHVPVIGKLADDEAHDLAIVRIAGGGYPVIPLALTERVAVGEQLVLIGSPFGFDQSVGVGILSAIREDYPDEYKKQREKDAPWNDVRRRGPLVQHTISSGPGSSGSPLVDMTGAVVGVNHSGYRGSEVNFGAHVDALRTLVDATDLGAEPKPLGNKRAIVIASVAVYGTLGLVVAIAYVLRWRRRRRLEAADRELELALRSKLH